MPFRGLGLALVLERFEVLLKRMDGNGVEVVSDHSGILSPVKLRRVGRTGRDKDALSSWQALVQNLLPEREGCEGAGSCARIGNAAPVRSYPKFEGDDR